MWRTPNAAVILNPAGRSRHGRPGACLLAGASRDLSGYAGSDERHPRKHHARDAFIVCRESGFGLEVQERIVDRTELYTLLIRSLLRGYGGGSASLDDPSSDRLRRDRPDHEAARRALQRCDCATDAAFCEAWRTPVGIRSLATTAGDGDNTTAALLCVSATLLVACSGHSRRSYCETGPLIGRSAAVVLRAGFKTTSRRQGRQRTPRRIRKEACSISFSSWRPWRQSGSLPLGFATGSLPFGSAIYWQEQALCLLCSALSCSGTLALSKETGKSALWPHSRGGGSRRKQWTPLPTRDYSRRASALRRRRLLVPRPGPGGRRY